MGYIKTTSPSFVSWPLENQVKLIIYKLLYFKQIQIFSKNLFQLLEIISQIKTMKYLQKSLSISLIINKPMRINFNNIETWKHLLLLNKSIHQIISITIMDNYFHYTIPSHPWQKNWHKNNFFLVFKCMMHYDTENIAERKP